MFLKISNNDEFQKCLQAMYEELRGGRMQSIFDFYKSNIEGDLLLSDETESKLKELQFEYDDFMEYEYDGKEDWQYKKLNDIENKAIRLIANDQCHQSRFPILLHVTAYGWSTRGDEHSAISIEFGYQNGLECDTNVLKSFIKQYK